MTVRAGVASVLVFAVAIACVRLGFWQLDRLEQRRARNAGLHARMAAPVADLARIPADSAGWLYRRVIVRGKFDHARSIILPGRAYRGVPGAHVVTPVLLSTGQAVLADRGWVPAADGATVQLASLPRDSTAADTAMVLPFPGQERRLGRATRTPTAGDSAFRRVWYAIDERALRAQFPYELGGIHVRLLPDGDAPAAPVREPAPALSEGSHLGYAIQWFSFAAIAVIGWVAVVLRSRRTARPKLRLHRDGEATGDSAE